MKYGTPASGVADRFAAETANLLAGNESRRRRSGSHFVSAGVAGPCGSCHRRYGREPDPDDQQGSFAHVAFRCRFDRATALPFEEEKPGFGLIWRFGADFPAKPFLNSRSVFARGLMGQPLQAKGY